MIETVQQPTCAQSARKKPLVIAHRGAPLLAFENTMASFGRAVAQGATAIELDVQVTRDRQLVVFHDVNVDRLTRGSGLVRYFNLSDLRKMLLHGKDRIPTLLEVLEAFKSKARFFVELKWTSEGIELVLDVLAEQGVLHEALICSFDQKTLQEARKISSVASLAYLRWIISEKDIAFGTELGLESINPNHGFLTERKVTEVHEAGMNVYTWTPDWSWEVRRMLRMGVDGVITNRFPSASKMVEQHVAYGINRA